MGPCRDCGQWHCICDAHAKSMRFLQDEIWVNKAACEAAIQEHRSLKARHDKDFQRFMERCMR